MAVRKASMQQQVAESIAQLNPADRPIVTFHTIVGPSPWLTSMLGMVGQAFVKYYFVTLTEQAVVVHRAGRLANRPKELVVAIPRAQAPQLLGEVKRNALWSALYFQLPNEPKPSRFNTHRIWRNERDEFVAALGQPAA